MESHCWRKYISITFGFIITIIMGWILAVSITVESKAYQSYEWITCSSCNGSRTETYRKTCSTCSGTGSVSKNVTCTTCSGSGKVSKSVTCSGCSGTGKVTTSKTCTKCTSGKVTVKKDCTTCSGSGRRYGMSTCTGCNGAGTVAATKNCTTCSGNGYYYSCSACGKKCTATSCTCGANRLGGWTANRKSCTTCGGDGKVSNGTTTCPTCNGKKQVEKDLGSCTSCKGLGYINTKEDCTTCGGDGTISEQTTCSKCSGNKTVTESSTCSTCNGNKTVSKSSTCSTCSGNRTVSATRDCSSCNGAGGSYGYVTRYDYTDPSVSVSVSNSSWTSSNVTIKITCSDSGGSGLDWCELWTSSGRVDRSGSSFTYTATSSGSFYGRAVDYDGNSSTTSYYTVKIDKANPTVSISLSSTSWASSVTVTASCSDSDSGISSCNIYDENGNLKKSGTSSATFSATNGMAYYVIGTDSVGNSKTSSNTSSAKVDGSDPSASISLSNSSWASSITVTATCSDSQSGIKSCKIYDKNGAEKASGTSSATFSAVNGMTYYAIGTDNVGHTNTSSSTAEAKVDGVNPSASIELSKTDWATSVTVTATCSDSESGIKSCKIYDKNGTEQATGTSSATFSAVNGMTYYAIGTDNVGHTKTSSSTAAAKVDGVNPSASIELSKTDWAVSVTVTATCSDSESGIKSCKIYDKNGTEKATGTSSATFNAVNGMTYYAIGTDNVGHTKTSSSTVAAKVDSAPTFKLGSSKMSFSSNGVTVTYTGIQVTHVSGYKVEIVGGTAEVTKGSGVQTANTLDLSIFVEYDGAFSASATWQMVSGGLGLTNGENIEVGYTLEVDLVEDVLVSKASTRNTLLVSVGLKEAFGEILGEINPEVTYYFGRSGTTDEAFRRYGKTVTFNELSEELESAQGLSGEVSLYMKIASGENSLVYEAKPGEALQLTTLAQVIELFKDEAVVQEFLNNKVVTESVMIDRNNNYNNLVLIGMLVLAIVVSIEYLVLKRKRA